MAKLTVLGGGVDEPVTVVEVQHLLDLDNRIAELQELRNALAANLMRRVTAQGPVLRCGPHRLVVKRHRDGDRREQELVVDGLRRFGFRVSRER